jgi:NAD-dependent SIR2 family protein deacetylase
MTIGFLLGAGFSKALHPSMPVVTELLKQIDMPKDIPQAIKNDLEQILSYLWTNYPWNTEIQHLKNKVNFLELNKQIYNIIANAEFDAWERLHNGNIPQHYVYIDELSEGKFMWQAQLAKLLCNSEKFSIITMNYDTLLERLMIIYGNIKLIYTAPLQRLNGIWNQYIPEGNTFTYYTGDIDSKFVFNKEPSLYKLHGSVSWFSLDALESNSPIYNNDMDKSYTFSKTDLEFDNSLFPIIVPPVADKSSLYNNKVLRSQWIRASIDLKKCDTLYCVGYSLPISDLPMRLFLSQACTNIKYVKIVDLKEDTDHSKRITAMLPSDAEVEWIVGEDAVKKMALRLFEEESL